MKETTKDILFTIGIILTIIGAIGGLLASGIPWYTLAIAMGVALVIPAIYKGSK